MGLYFDKEFSDCPSMCLLDPEKIFKCYLGYFNVTWH